MSNWLDPAPKLMRGYSSQSPPPSWATWSPSTWAGLLAPSAGVTEIVPWLAA
jgi:hypothetical protein